MHYAGCHGPLGGLTPGFIWILGELEIVKNMSSSFSLFSNQKFLYCLNFLNLDIVPHVFSALEFSAHKLDLCRLKLRN